MLRAAEAAGVRSGDLPARLPDHAVYLAATNAQVDEVAARVPFWDELHGDRRLKKKTEIGGRTYYNSEVVPRDVLFRAGWSDARVATQTAPAFTMTFHRAQGRTWEGVAVYVDTCRLSREAAAQLYVGLTRVRDLAQIVIV